MEFEGALARLPETYATALRLRAQGLSEPAIAAELKLEPKAIGPLLRLADAKLTALLETPSEAVHDPHAPSENQRDARTKYGAR